MSGELLGLKESYLSRLRALGTEALKLRLFEAEGQIRLKSAYSIMPWEEVKMEIEDELGRRSGVSPARDVAGLIWELRDA